MEVVMNKSIFYGVLLSILVLGGMIYWFFQTIPSANEIEDARVNIIPVNVNLMSNPTVKTIKGLDKNGNIPVTTQNKGLGRTDPF